MANDIIDINVYETVETVAITVNPNLTTVNINKVTGGGGITNLSTTQTATDFTINSDTGDDALVPLGNGTLAGATLNDYTTAEKTKLSGIETGAEVNVNADWNAVSGDAQILNKPTISGTNTGDQNLQSVTNLGASTTTPITANSFVKSGGTSSQILAADGSVITAGTNITITGGQISSVGGTGGGGSSVNYYLNGGTSQGTFGGTTYYEFSKTAVIGTGADFSRGTNGYIASFITDVADPSLLLIPAGNWNLEFFFSSSSAGGSPSFYVELYKYDGTTFTSIASSSATPEGITNGTAIDAYFTPLAVPETVLTVNDRLAIRVFVNASSKTITLHTQNGHLCEVITTFTAGLTALNGLQAQVQNFATGTTGTDFAINSSGSTHTFNLPSASATNRGALSSANWTTFNNKLTPNAAITGATNTKITYDANGLVTSGTTLIASDIPNIAQSQVTSLTTDLGLKANLASPTFSGTPTLPTETIATTQTAGDSSTKLATTAFVTTANNLKQDKSLSAYKLIANNTNTTANGVEQVYKDIAEATDLSTVSTISWIATTAPTSPISLNYKWTQIGSLVIARFNLNYTNAGTTVQQLSITLPNTMPTPLSPNAYTAANDVLYQVIGNYAGSKAAAGAMPTSSVLRRNAANNGYELVINRVAAAVTSAQLTVQYFT